MTPFSTAFCLAALLFVGERDVTVPPAFRKLERAPVPFNHDQHTAALQTEGCQRCHPAGDFSFPKVRNETSAKKWMNSFHDACMACHKQRAAENKKAGPLTCGECHRVKKYAPAAWPKVAFDYAVHDKHDKALEQKCDLCHYMSPERQQKLAGTKPEHRDWLLDADPAKSLADRNAAHLKCLNCHLTRATEKQKAGPLTCAGCHSAKPRSAQEIAAAPRPQCGQKDQILIALKEGARFKTVPFNHKTHESYSRSCQECHHQTLRACGDCHKLAGTTVSLADAHHSKNSTWSCVGCHETVKAKPNCAGCHDTMRHGLVQSACNSCHSGPLKNFEPPHKLPPPGDLIPKETKEKIEIAGLKKEYKPSLMPHMAIANKLTDISNRSTLASWFHRHSPTICMGCHHNAPVGKDAPPPACVVCHAAKPPTDATTPSLLGAYHQECLGCHKQMTEKKLPQDCIGCHEKQPKPGKAE
jgi:hypothetical protein